MEFECDDLEVGVLNSEENMRALLFKQVWYVANVSKWIRVQYEDLITCKQTCQSQIDVDLMQPDDSILKPRIDYFRLLKRRMSGISPIVVDTTVRTTSKGVSPTFTNSLSVSLYRMTCSVDFASS